MGMIGRPLDILRVRGFERTVAKTITKSFTQFCELQSLFLVGMYGLYD